MSSVGFFLRTIDRKKLVKGFIWPGDIEKDGLGFRVFNATNDEIIANEPTTSFLTDTLRGGPRTRGVRGSDVQSKARVLLGFRELHNWRKYAPGRDRS
jgi:hypothetical protein